MASDTAAAHGGRSYWKPSVTVAGTVAAIAALVGLASVFIDRVPEWVGHGLGHALPALPLLFLVGVASRRWPPARTTRPGRTGRRVAVVGLAGVSLGQVLEVAGARVDEPGALLVEEVAHTAGQIVTMLSLPLVILGMLACLVAGAREGAVPKTAVAAVGAVAVALFVFLMIGAPGGS